MVSNSLGSSVGNVRRGCHFVNGIRRILKMASTKKLTPKDVLDIKRRLKHGEYQHHIAAAYGLNQGRISEIKNGHRFAEISPPHVDQPDLI